MTNGDRIRKMTDEELAMRLSCPYVGKSCQMNEDIPDCVLCIEYWLKEEVEDENC